MTCCSLLNAHPGGILVSLFWRPQHTTPHHHTHTTHHHHHTTRLLAPKASLCGMVGVVLSRFLRRSLPLLDLILLQTNIPISVAATLCRSCGHCGSWSQTTTFITSISKRRHEGERHDGVPLLSTPVRNNIARITDKHDDLFDREESVLVSHLSIRNGAFYDRCQWKS